MLNITGQLLAHLWPLFFQNPHYLSKSCAICLLTKFYIASKFCQTPPRTCFPRVIPLIIIFYILF
uniref:Uncharacterized protein n=1 Tax=Anguilla anguilla TaxID=7936 RepID=A0A0E9PMN3_ANGAN